MKTGFHSNRRHLSGFDASSQPPTPLLSLPDASPPNPTRRYDLFPRRRRVSPLIRPDSAGTLGVERTTTSSFRPPCQIDTVCFCSSLPLSAAHLCGEEAEPGAGGEPGVAQQDRHRYPPPGDHQADFPPLIRSKCTSFCGLLQS